MKLGRIIAEREVAPATAPDGDIPADAARDAGGDAGGKARGKDTADHSADHEPQTPSRSLLRRRSRSARRTSSRSASLAAHRAFAPLVGLWGAALGGLGVLVLPDRLIARMAASGGFTGLGEMARFALAGMAAAALGALVFMAALALTRAARSRGTGDPVIRPASLRPLRPAQDLGSESFDAPMDTMPLGMRIEDWDDEPEGDVPEDSPEDSPAATGATEAPEAPETPEASETGEAEIDTAAGRPREVSLAEFADLPGRNAVWIEDPQTERVGLSPHQRRTGRDQAHEAPDTPAGPEESSAAPSEPAAIARLRSVPPGDLSLVQMVERFAAALHEREATARRNGRGTGERERDAVLSEALKALTLLADGESTLSGSPATDSDGSDAPPPQSERERELRDALVKLQSLRGAA